MKKQELYNELILSKLRDFEKHLTNLELKMALNKEELLAHLAALDDAAVASVTAYNTVLKALQDLNAAKAAAGVDVTDYQDLADQVDQIKGELFNNILAGTPNADLTPAMQAAVEAAPVFVVDVAV